MKEKRKLRHLVSRILMLLMAGDIALVLLAAIFNFGLYNPSTLAESFERSGYYLSRRSEAQEAIGETLKEAGLPEEIFDFSAFEDDFEQKMRSQVYGRNDRIPELESISVVGHILAGQQRRELSRTIQSDRGILKLSDTISEILLETSRIPGISDWWEGKAALEDSLKPMAAVLAAFFLFKAGILWLIQSRKQRVCTYTSLAFVIGGAAGLIELFWIYRKISALSEGTIKGVWELYRRGVLDAGLEICAAVFLAGAVFAIIGQALKHNH